VRCEQVRSSTQCFYVCVSPFHLLLLFVDKQGVAVLRGVAVFIVMIDR